MFSSLKVTCRVSLKRVESKKQPNKIINYLSERTAVGRTTSYTACGKTDASNINDCYIEIITWHSCCYGGYYVSVTDTSSKSGWSTAPTLTPAEPDDDYGGTVSGMDRRKSSATKKAMKNVRSRSLVNWESDILTELSVTLMARHVMLPPLIRVFVTFRLFVLSYIVRSFRYPHLSI